MREATKKVDVISRQAAIDGADAIIARDTSGNNDVVKAMTAWKEYINGLPSAQPEQRWVSVTERLPDKEDWYIFSTDKITWIAFWNGIEWSGGVAHAVLKDIIAWMPLPAPYREEGEAE